MAVLLLLPFCPAAARGKKIKKVKISDNPAEYRAFGQPLPQDDRLHHALARLTFGARPGDREQLEQAGLDRWIERQLHPERVLENPTLAERLAPLESLRLNIHDTYTHYPAPKAIAAVARGKRALPDDPELRAIVVRLADRYLEKKQAGGGAAASTARAALNDPEQDTDLDLRVHLEDILTPAQIAMLRNGAARARRHSSERTRGLRLGFAPGRAAAVVYSGAG